MIKRESLFSTGGMSQSDRCLHTPGSFAKENLLYVQEVGKLKSMKPHRCVRENLDSFLFLIVLEGKGSLDVKGKHYQVDSGSCALIDCMEHFEHISDEQDAWRLAWVHFNGSSARGYYELFMRYNKDENIFKVQDTHKWDDLLKELLNRQKERNLQSELYCAELIQHLLNMMIENVADLDIVASEEEKAMANEIRKQVNVQYADAKVLEELEKSFGESIAELSGKFRRHFGISLEEYISNRRFNAAKELLRFSIKPVDEVVTESGIGDLIAMQKMFQDNEGMSAEEYRAKWAAWIRN